MPESTLLAELISLACAHAPHAVALTHAEAHMSYGELDNHVRRFASGLIGLGVARSERVAIYLEKRFETAIASFGAAAAGMVFVPINPLLKPHQVAFILQDCNVRVLVTSPERIALLIDVLAGCQDLVQVVVTASNSMTQTFEKPAPNWGHLTWNDFLDFPPRYGHRVIDTDMAAILYTSGSTGKPKGVVLSHRNMVAGAKSVASYLENNGQDTLLAALPPSFYARFRPLTTAFSSGGCGKWNRVHSEG